jgi:RNA polymerase sigma-70 factor (ECF subfamily)
MKSGSDMLLKRAQGGDMDAFAELFEPLRPLLFNVACRLVGPDDAEDVVMETFLKAWQAIPRYRGKAALRTWLYRIAYNHGLDVIRRRGRSKERVLSEKEVERDAWENMPDHDQRGPDEAVAVSELTQQVRAAMEELSAEHRTALLLRFVDGLTYAELAAATGVSIGTVMSRLFYAKRKLRAIVEARERS